MLTPGEKQWQQSIVAGDAERDEHARCAAAADGVQRKRQNDHQDRLLMHMIPHHEAAQAWCVRALQPQIHQGSSLAKGLGVQVAQ